MKRHAGTILAWILVITVAFAGIGAALGYDSRHSNKARKVQELLEDVLRLYADLDR